MKLQFNGASLSVDAADGDGPRISGIAVPYNVDASVSTGQTVRILEGALPTTGRMPRLVLEHDTSRVVGVVDQREDTPEGMLFSARIADTAEGRDLVALLKMGALDSVSVGIMATAHEQDGRTMVVKSATWEELSVVYQPAFEGAIITEIAASQPDADEPQPLDTDEENSEMSQENPTVEASAETVPTTPIWANARREFVLPSASEWISAQLQGGSIAAEMNAKVKAAAPDVVTGDLSGIMPTPIVSPIYSGIRGLRPVVDAIGVRAMPASGKVFIRPVITTHSSIGGPATENTAITASAFVVDDVQITKGIYGGYVELSEASLDWSQPEVLGALLEDMAKVYANATDNVAADALLAGTSQATGNVAVTDPTDWVAKVYAASVTILSQGNYLPDHLFVSPDVFGQLGQLSDTADRPLFPQVGPMNAFGSMTPGTRDSTVFGLRLVVDTNFAAKTCIVGAAATGAFENWETPKGAISIDQPSTLSRQIAFRGYFASKMLDATKFMKIPQA